jgi:methionyl-tRNA formyltransferase
VSRRRLRIVFLGSGAFGLPSIEAIAARHDLVGVVSQPDKPAGRGRTLTPTPIAAWVADRTRAGTAIDLLTTADVNDAASTAWIDALAPDALVVIAFGQKIAPALVDRRFAINLHGSLLPAYRGAAPIAWAMINGPLSDGPLREGLGRDGRGREADPDGPDPVVTGVTVISIAQRMDAGLIFATRSTAIDPYETCGELHDRLALLGPEALLEVLNRFAEGSIAGAVQDEGLATRARKLSKVDGRIDPRAASAIALRRRIHGLTPWPGCDLVVGGATVRLLRVRDVERHGSSERAPGTIDEGGRIVCARGSLEVVELQPHGGTPMSLAAYRAGRGARTWTPGAPAEPVQHALGGGGAS